MPTPTNNTDREMEKAQELATTNPAKQALMTEQVKRGDSFIEKAKNYFANSAPVRGLAQTYTSMTYKKYKDIHENLNREIPDKKDLKTVPKALKEGDKFKDSKGNEKKALQEDVEQRNNDILAAKADNKIISKDNKQIDHHSALKNQAEKDVKQLENEFEHAKSNHGVQGWADIGKAFKSWEKAMELEVAYNGESSIKSFTTESSLVKNTAALGQGAYNKGKSFGKGVYSAGKYAGNGLSNLAGKIKEYVDSKTSTEEPSDSNTHNKPNLTENSENIPTNPSSSNNDDPIENSENIPTVGR